MTLERGLINEYDWNKKICQNPKCCNATSLDRWHKKINKYQSRKAYFNINSIRHTVLHDTLLFLYNTLYDILG